MGFNRRQSIFMLELSPLAKKRLEYKPKVPDLLRNLQGVAFAAVPSAKKPHASLRSLFPKTFDLPVYQLGRGTGRGMGRVGVVFSGGQAAGGHNVIAGLYDSGATLIGFLGGPSGIIENKAQEIKDVDFYRNQGGFDLIGSGRTKIETKEQLEAALKTVLAHRLDGLVIIGGDDSNTNAAILAEYFEEKGCATRVVGVPKTIDGDLRSEEIEISFGFDSACKTYAEMIGNIARDVLSAKKYYHFIKLMGRSASNVALECALATHPNLTLIGEERKSLSQIVAEIADLIEKRASMGKEYGVILIPEGLVEFVPDLMEIAKKFPLEKDPHGNILVSQIETEELIIELVKQELGKRKFQGKFHAQGHFFGYEGRACLPSNFDANYCYALGLLASLCVREGLTGVICAIQGLTKPPSAWQLKAVPIVQLMHMETRLGKEKPVIRKALVDIKGSSFVRFSHLRKSWALEDQYRFPGPMQFFGDAELTDLPPITLCGS
jgi:pyrophosphate--fructose-6-phosphate 1-phosphotransferase